MKICYRCKEILTFCECEKSITTKDEYIEALEWSLAKDGERLTLLNIEVNALRELLKGIKEYKPIEHKNLESPN